MRDFGMFRNRTDASPREKSARRFAYAVYVLQVGGLATVLPALVGLALNRLAKEEARGTWVESHFRWQIRTAWLCLLFGVLAVGAAALLDEVSDDPTAALNTLMIAWIGVFLWGINRVVKGLTRLRAGRAME